MPAGGHSGRKGSHAFPRSRTPARPPQTFSSNSVVVKNAEFGSSAAGSLLVQTDTNESDRAYGYPSAGTTATGMHAAYPGNAIKYLQVSACLLRAGALLRLKTAKHSSKIELTNLPQ